MKLLTSVLVLAALACAFAEEEASTVEEKGGPINLQGNYQRQGQYSASAPYSGPVYPAASYNYGVTGDFKYRNDYSYIPYYCPYIHKCFDGYQLRHQYFECPVLFKFDCNRGKGYHGRFNEPATPYDKVY